MRKAWWELEGELKKVDLFIEVRDAWIPFTSWNKALIDMIPAGVKWLVVLNKIDLANTSKTKLYLEHIKKEEKVEAFGLSA